MTPTLPAHMFPRGWIGICGKESGRAQMFYAVVKRGSTSEGTEKHGHGHACMHGHSHMAGAP
eukprot:364040-Chlamydomonas_euryale.AAC.4